jgi:8-oxo-dGTP pyrophosphatase MutT (NUDIX family)
MRFSPEIIRRKLQNTSLPGLQSHLKLAPAQRISEIAGYPANGIVAKKSAVMILLFEENEQMKVIFIRRSIYVGLHAGQIAFPGGRYEESDGNVQITALREIEEEIGIHRGEIEVLGQLTDIYVPPSNFLISIFVGFLSKKPHYNPDKREVAEIIEIPLADFFLDNIIHEKNFQIPSTSHTVNAPFYKVGSIELWGASAMVMTEFIDVLKSP